MVKKLIDICVRLIRMLIMSPVMLFAFKPHVPATSEYITSPDLLYGTLLTYVYNKSKTPVVLYDFDLYYSTNYSNNINVTSSRQYFIYEWYSYVRSNDERKIDHTNYNTMDLILPQYEELVGESFAYDG